VGSEHPYRDEQRALEQRLGELEGVQKKLEQQETALRAALAAKANVARELGDLRLRLKVLRHRSLPTLDRAKIASPCDAAWSNMAGDDKTRRCRRCSQSVHNAEAMTREELEKLAQDACVRLFRRADGTVLTRDCPESARRRWRRMGLALLVTGATTAALAAQALTPTLGRMRMPLPDECPSRRTPGHRGAELPAVDAPAAADGQGGDG
jgi:hypothetical protein